MTVWSASALHAQLYLSSCIQSIQLAVWRGGSMIVLIS